MGTIADKLQKLLSTKAAIKTAIEEKGQTVPDTAPFSAYADKIRDIQTGMTQEEADERYLKRTGDRGVGKYIFQREGDTDVIIINGDFSPQGSIYFNAGGSDTLYVCRDQNIQGGTYIAAHKPINGDTLSYLAALDPRSDEEVATKKYVDQQLVIPSGIVVMWSGTADDIPTGWALCNGENGTPDLRGRFILGASGGGGDMLNLPESAIKGAHQTGGEAEHKLTINEMPSHRHSQDYNTVYRDYVGTNSAYSLPAYREFANDASDGQYIEGYTLETGGGQSHNNMPLYYALCYIMKL